MSTSHESSIHRARPALLFGLLLALAVSACQTAPAAPDMETYRRMKVLQSQPRPVAQGSPAGRAQR